MKFTTCSIRKIDSQLITEDIKVLREYISNIFSNNEIFNYQFSTGIRISLDNNIMLDIKFNVVYEKEPLIHIYFIAKTKETIEISTISIPLFVRLSQDDKDKIEYFINLYNEIIQKHKTNFKLK